MTTLNETQSKAVKHNKGALLVVAGAGTGKTRVITERMRYLIQEKNIKPNEILALTFTEKSANEMVERVDDIMPLGYEEPWIYTFHSFADRILRTEGIEIGLDPTYKVLSGPEQWILLRKNIFHLGIDYFLPLGNPTKFISAALKFISRLQDENISPNDLKDFSDKVSSRDVEPEEKKRWEELSKIYTAYQELKIKNSRLDFGDLITWTIKLFNERPNILSKYQKQFKHIMVDEFQDTNYAQYELIKMLFPKQTKDRTLIAVGDDSQSIYKFRGAAISNILEFMKDYPDAEMVTLLQNYRSTQVILDPAYSLIQNNNPDTLESKLGISKRLVSETKEKSVIPVIAHAETLEDEVDFVVSKIYEILGTEESYTYKDIAILARANNHLEPFVMALRQKGIPYQLVGNRGLYDREEVRNVIALLKTIINPQDSISLYRVMNMDGFAIPVEEIAEVLSQSRIQKKDMWEIIKESTSPAIVSFYESINLYQQNTTKRTPVEFVYQLVHNTGLVAELMSEETVEKQLAVKNLNLLLNIIKRFEVDFHSENKEYPTVVDLIDYLELMLEAGDNPAQAEIEDIDTVNLLTTHASKGLEFPVVFIVNIVSDRFPTRNKSDIIEIPDELIKETLPTGDEHIQEERRLFYVGMTRAQKYLFMTLGKDYGGKREKRPSGFLNETGLVFTNVVNEEKNTNNQQTLITSEAGFEEILAKKITDFTPDFLSYSQIESYIKCPLQYKYKYVLNIPTAPNNATSFGTTIHDTLNELHTRLVFDNEVSYEDLLEMYNKHWQPLGYKDQDHRELQFEKGKELLKRYYDQNVPVKVKPVALEKKFSIKIDGINFRGRIDRIDPIAEGGVEIIDYKTGGIKTQKEVDKDLQVALYAIGAKEALGLEPKQMSLYFLEEGTKVCTTRTETQLMDAKREVINVIGQIKKGEFEANPGIPCNWCDFKDICPFAYKG